jgi:succinyldiaminopimelate transaminase
MVNDTTAHLPPYPTEELTRIRKEREKAGLPVYDFGPGDPQLGVDPRIKEALIQAIDQGSRYPSILGEDYLGEAHRAYLKNRFAIDPEPFSILPTRGSKEGIFHLALSLVGRAGGRRTIAYPAPGYPIYDASVDFAQGVHYPVHLNAQNNFLTLPWDWPKEVIKDLAAIWINYPHNPTGTVAPFSYLKELVDFCRKHNICLLGDECYLDIYDPGLKEKPRSILELGPQGLVSLMSLSKRSGLTGYRAGFMAGDPKILVPHSQARARFGSAQPQFVQAAARAAWLDETHVAKRREIFDERMTLLSNALIELGLMDQKPQAALYLWARVPKAFNGDDVVFCRRLAQEIGIITVPSRWLGDPKGGFFRMACVPDRAETEKALALLKAFISGQSL